MATDSSSTPTQEAGQVLALIPGIVSLVTTLVQQGLAWKSASDAQKAQLAAASEAAYKKCLADIATLDADLAKGDATIDGEANAKWGPK